MGFFSVCPYVPGIVLLKFLHFGACIKWLSFHDYYSSTQMELRWLGWEGLWGSLDSSKAHWPAFLQWKGFLDLADGISDEKLDQIIDSQKPNQCCALVYKQGISGPPKATMLSHDNVSGAPGGNWPSEVDVGTKNLGLT